MANVSFRLFLGLLFGIQYLVYAEVQGRLTEKSALIGQQANLTCNLNSTKDVTWLYDIGKNDFVTIYTCTNDRCELNDAETITGIVSGHFDHIGATQSNDISILSLTPSNEKKYAFKCKLVNGILQEYSVKSIDLLNIVPNCSVILPSSNENGVGSMTLSCEVNSGELDVSLSLEGIGLNFPVDSAGSSQSIKAKTLSFDDFNNDYKASCMAYFSDIDVKRNCTYPNIVKAQCLIEGNDIIIECDDESVVDHWRLYSSDGREDDFEDRAWIRDGGRSLLILDISEKDVGKVVVCRIKGDDNQTNKGTIGFHVISKIPGDNNKPNSEDPTLVPSAQNAYFVSTLFFLTLWLITLTVFGVLFGCTPKRNKSGSIAIASASGNASVPNGDSGERGTSLINVGTGARGDPNTLNTNNSAHNPVFVPVVNSRPTHENSRNRQSNNDSHLYFTLEKSSPSPMNSLPRASAARWEQPDANPASLNHPQSSHSQCYETVGEPNKGATCSYDLGEYAEVGMHFQGEGPPDIGEYTEVGKHFHVKGSPDLSGRPSIREKPKREKVKGEDISRLYSKVNK